MTMTLFETKTLGTSVGSIQFTSIPQNSTDLFILLSTRQTSTTGTVYISFNGNSTGYTFRRLNSSGSAANSDNYSTSAIYWNDTGTNETANTFGNSAVYIPNYRGTTNKSVGVDSVPESNSANYIGAQMSIVAGVWENTAAITSINFGSNASFAAGSTISLYGVTKGSDGITTTS
jgi:hypothetical protein